MTPFNNYNYNNINKKLMVLGSGTRGINFFYLSRPNRLSDRLCRHDSNRQVLVFAHFPKGRWEWQKGICLLELELLQFLPALFQILYFLSIFLPTLSISLLIDLISSGIISSGLVDLPLNNSFSPQYLLSCVHIYYSIIIVLKFYFVYPILA